MRPSFNVAGPCILGEHYMLPPERRLGRVLELVEEHRDFTLHAGRQTGKTTSARWMVEHYNAAERFCALWVDIQDARELSDPARCRSAKGSGSVTRRLVVSGCQLASLGAPEHRRPAHRLQEHRAAVPTASGCALPPNDQASKPQHVSPLVVVFELKQLRPGPWSDTPAWLVHSA